MTPEEMARCLTEATFAYAEMLQAAGVPLRAGLEGVAAAWAMLDRQKTDAAPRPAKEEESAWWTPERKAALAALEKEAKP